ncbi:MAG: hypothetical protein ABR910_00920 [Acidobacteriaceae bacterium]|jgi:hypothetical protein
MSSFVIRLALVFIAGAAELPLHAQSGAQSSAQAAPPAAVQGAPAQAKPAPLTAAAGATAAPSAYSGCVMESATDKGTFILSADSVCARLTGKLATSDLSGHQIEIEGVLTPRVARTPASIEIDSVHKIGKSCSEVCSLLPPGTRGLGGERPGKEGGRPGLTPDTQPNPQ